MKTRHFLRNGLLLSLFALFLLQTTVQAHQYVHVKGDVYSENKKALNEVTIQILADGELYANTTNDEDGSFTFRLAYDHRFTFLFSKDGYISKTVVIDTKSIPKHEQEKGHFAVPFELQLFEDIPCLDLSFLDMPIAKFLYSFSENDIVHDPTHTAPFQQGIAEVKTLWSKLDKRCPELETASTEVIADSRNTVKPVLKPRSIVKAVEPAIVSKEQLSEVIIAPNPSNGHFRLLFDENISKTNLQVLDLSGRAVLSEDITVAAGAAYQLDLSNEQAGMYLILLSTSEGQSTHNLVIQR